MDLMYSFSMTPFYCHTLQSVRGGWSRGRVWDLDGYVVVGDRIASEREIINDVYRYYWSGTHYTPFRDLTLTRNNIIVQKKYLHFFSATSPIRSFFPLVISEMSADVKVTLL